MRVHTCIEYQMTDDGLELIREQGFEYEGEVALCKGDKEAKKREQEQFAMQQEAWNRQKQQMDTVNNSFSKYLSGDIGLDPALLALMKSQALDDNATGYNNAGSALRLALQRNGDMGGNLPMSGGGVRGIATLLSARAGDEANALRGIRMADAQQKLVNQMNAGSLMSGNAAALSSPISSFTSGANSALAQYLQSKQTGFGASFKNAFGSALGQGLGNLATFGMGGLTGANKAGFKV